MNPKHDLSNLKKCTSINSYTVSELIKIGGQGLVFKVIFKDEFFAAKVFIDKNTFENESKIFEVVKGTEGVLQLVEMLEKPQIKIKNQDQSLKTYSVMIFKYYPEKDLQHYIIESRKRKIDKGQRKLSFLSFEGAKTIFYQLLVILQKLSKKGIVHKDIKPSNILLDSKFMPILADLGCSFKIDSGQYKHRFDGGTSHYKAPEFKEKKFLSSSCDVFSLGVVFFQIIFAGHPFDTQSYENTLKIFSCPFHTQQGNKYWKEVIKTYDHGQIPADIRNIFHKIFVSDYQKRSSIDSLLKDDDFFKQKATWDEVQKEFKFISIPKNKLLSNIQDQQNQYLPNYLQACSQNINSNNQKPNGHGRKLQMIRPQMMRQKFEPKQLRQFVQIYINKAIDVKTFKQADFPTTIVVQNIQNYVPESLKSIQSSQFSLQSSANMILAWIEFYLKKQIEKNRLFFQYILVNAQSISLQPFKSDSFARFFVNIKVQNTINEQLSVVGVKGEFLKNKDNNLRIQWTVYDSSNELQASLVKYMQKCILILHNNQKMRKDHKGTLRLHKKMTV